MSPALDELSLKFVIYSRSATGIVADIGCGDGIATAAALHLIAVLPPTPSALVPVEPLLEFDCSEHPLREEVVKETIRLDSDGLVAVPEAPGLGVTLNLEFVQNAARG